MADQAPDPATGEDQGASSFAPWYQKPEIGNRGLVLMVVVPVLLAAAAFGLVSWVSAGDETQATAARVPTSDWIPGQAGGSERIAGQLAVDASRCVYLDDVATGDQVWPIWPAGFYARFDDEGHVSLYDGHDRLVARGGEMIQATGEFVAPTPYAGQECVPDTGEVGVIKSDVTSTSG